jgi:hypothetical protein
VADMNGQLAIAGTNREQEAHHDPSVLTSGVSLTPTATRHPPPPDPIFTRHAVASRILWGYLLFLGVVIATPIVLMLIKGTTVDDASKITIALSGALSGLVGVLGYVIGFYFKGEEQKAQAVAESATPRRPGSNRKQPTAARAVSASRN